jgi:MFS family permease
MEVLAAGRLIQGFGGGGLMSVSQALIADLVIPRERGRAQGYVASIGTIASTLGPVVGGIVVAALGWRSLFAATIPLAILAALILWRAGLPGERGHRRPFDLRGFLWLNAFTIALTAGIEMAKIPGSVLWSSVLALCAIASLAMLVRGQRTSDNPMFPPRLFEIAAVTRASVMVTCHGAALVSLMTLLPLFQTILRGESTLDVSVTLLALTAAFGISGIATGNLITITGRTAIFPTIALPLAAAGLVALGAFGADLSRVGLGGLYVWIGLCIGTVMSVIHTTVQNEAPADLRGRASGAVTFFRSVGAVVGTALVSLVLFWAAPLSEGADPEAVLSASTSNMIERDGWAVAFRLALFTVAAFVMGAWAMAVTTPSRRVP